MKILKKSSKRGGKRISQYDRHMKFLRPMDYQPQLPNEDLIVSARTSMPAKNSRVHSQTRPQG